MRNSLAGLALVAASVAVACAVVDPHKNQAAFIFGAHGSDAMAWAAKAREEETKVELVTREWVNEKDAYRPVAIEDLDRHVQAATYVVVRRWLTVPELLRVDALASVVWKDLSNHLGEDIKSITSGNPVPAEVVVPDNRERNPASAVAQYLESSAEDRHKPRALGGFGAVMCGLHGVAFVLPVVTHETTNIAEKVKSGLSLSDRESRQHKLQQIRELLTSPTIPSP